MSRADHTRARSRPRRALTRGAGALAAVVLLALAGCSPRASKPAPVAAPSRNAPVATVQELMDALVDPSADALWEAVSTEVTAAGTVERQPRSEVEWTALRHHALRLVEGARLLAEPGRHVAAPGRQIEDAHVAGILTAPEIQAAIERDRPAFQARAAALKESAQQALTAIEARDAQQLLRVGQSIDQACEHCHSVYWYPNDKRPGAAVWPAPVSTPPSKLAAVPLPSRYDATETGTR